MQTGLDTRLIITPGMNDDQWLRPPVTACEKTIVININAPVQHGAQNYFFPRDQELEDSIILGMQYATPLNNAKDPKGNFIYLRPQFINQFMVTLIDKQNKKKFDSYPLFRFVGGSTVSNFNRAYIRFVEDTRLSINKCYIRLQTGTTFSGMTNIPMLVSYAPKGMKRS